MPHKVQQESPLLDAVVKLSWRSPEVLLASPVQSKAKWNLPVPSSKFFEVQVTCTPSELVPVTVMAGGSGELVGKSSKKAAGRVEVEREKRQTRNTSVSVCVWQVHVHSSKYDTDIQVNQTNLTS